MSPSLPSPRRHGRFLVVEERINRRLVFNQPAGHVESGETLLAAVVREAREETAWCFEPRGAAGRVPVAQSRHGPRDRCGLPSPAAVADHDAAQPLDRGILRHALADPARSRAQPQRLRSPLVLRCVHDYLAGRRQTLQRWRSSICDGAGVPPRRGADGRQRGDRPRTVRCARRPARRRRTPEAPSAARCAKIAACPRSIAPPAAAHASSSVCPAASTPRSPPCCCRRAAGTCRASS